MALRRRWSSFAVCCCCQLPLTSSFPPAAALPLPFPGQRARAETVNIDQIEDAALSVKIVEFFPVGEKLVYRIETNVCCGCWYRLRSFVSAGLPHHTSCCITQTSLTDVFQERNFTCCRKYEGLWYFCFRIAPADNIQTFVPLPPPHSCCRL